MDQKFKLDKKNIENIYELTPLQEGMLFHQLSRIKGNIYFVQLSLELEGSIDIDIFQKAWQFVVDSNELLRTIFRWEGFSKPLQIVLKEIKVDFIYYDLTEKQNPKFEIETIKRKDYEKSFNLLDIPFRLTLCKYNKNEYLLLISNHHIIYDGWSNGIILKEFIYFYNDLIKGNKPKAKIKKPYKQFVLLNKQEESEGLSFWKSYLNNYEKNSFFKFKHLSSEGEVTELTTFLIPSKKTEFIKKRCEQFKITISDLLYNAWGILLSKYSRVEDVIFGTTISGRNVKLEGIEDMVGLFINTIPLRLNLPYEKPLANLICENSDKIREREPFENIPLHKILENSKYKNDELFESIFVIENYPLDEKLLKEGSALKIKSFLINETTNYKLTVSIIISNEIELHFKYYSSDIDSYVVENIGKHFVKIIESIISDSESTIQSLDILSEEEKHQILYEFNETKKDYPQGKDVIGLFKEQVEKYKENIAIKQEEDTLNYFELQRRAEKVSILLRSLGVIPGDVVAIEQYRSIDMVVSIFGILQAGCAYLPIDPNYPTDRKAYIVNDSESRFLLTSSEIDNRYGNHITKIFIDSLPSSLENTELHKIDTELNPPCYIIYTSGSTGKPKGVQVCHSSVINLLYYLQDFYPVNTNDSYLFKTSYCFDVSISELFGWMLGGGYLTILNKDEEKDADKIIKIICSAKVTHVNFVPSMFNVFSDSLSIDCKEMLMSLKYVFLAGETLKEEHLKKFKQLGLTTRIENLYGPTEATVYSSMYSVSQIKNGTVPIGKGISNTNLYILDKYNQLQTIGVAGELCISGECLAVGYLNNPELTDEKFIKSPFNQRKKLYKTGDLARWLPDGNLEFLGRIDQQVKIRGFRIELGEIESVLLRHELIKEAVVIVNENVSKDSLCAYYVSESEIDVFDLRQYLGEKVPDYMIPSFFMRLDSIPLSSNGKIDRKILPNPEIKQVEGFIAPRNKIEEILTSIWRDVLGMDSISIDDNYLMLGGDSIKSIQISSRLRKYGYKIEVQDIFLYPTISKLSLNVKKLDRVADQSLIIGEIPLTPIQKEFLSTIEGNKQYFNQSIMLYSPKRFDKEILISVFFKLQEHHDALRCIYKYEEEWVCQINQAVGYPLSMEEFDYRNSDNYVNIVEEKCNTIQSSINLGNGPLMKLGLFHLQDGDHLLIVIHHMVIDGISWRILLEDIDTLYQQLLRKEQLVLPSKTDSFKLWSEKQVEYANSPKLMKEKTFWQSLEMKMKQAPEIQRDSEGSNRIIDQVSDTFLLSEEATSKLLTKVNKAFNTEINDILIAALGLGFKDSFGFNNMCLAVEGHGREYIAAEIDVSRTIGWFTSLYPMQIDMSYCSDLSRHIKETKETLHRIPNKGIGYGILKHITSNENKQDLQFPFTPQICFNYLGQYDTDLRGKSTYSMSLLPQGNAVYLEQDRVYDITISGIITEGKLQITVYYSQQQYERTRIRAFVENYNQSLTKIIQYCTEKEAVEFTPCDFQCKDLSINKLNEIYEKNAVINIYKLSPLQGGMLFHYLKDKSSQIYFEQVTYHLIGELNIELVEKTMISLVDRYEILRTMFVFEDVEEPIQIVLAERKTDYSFKDVQNECSERTCEEVIESYKVKDRLRVFDLFKDVLIRLTVLQTASNEYEFIWSFHHIIMDGWCMSIIINEFTEIYSKIKNGKKTALPPVKPYSQYIEWLEERDKEVSVEYWKNYLNSYESLVTIPNNGNLSLDKLPCNLESKHISINERKTKLLQGISREYGVTINSILQCAWGILLANYNSVNDVVFGSVVSGRPAEIEDIEIMAGLFINTIPVRVTYGVKDTLEDILRTIQNRALESEHHHYSSLSEIQNQSVLGRGLFNHIMVFENYPITDHIRGNKSGNADKGYAIKNVQVFELTNYDLTLIVIPGNEIHIRIDYSTKQYNQDIIERALNHFNNVIEQIISNSKAQVSDIEIINQEEKQSLLSGLNNSEVFYPKDKTVHDLFKTQAKRNAESIAAKLNNQTITYGELDKLTDKLAYQIREYGVKPDDVIGLLMDRSIETIIGMLSILKAGGAYLPIDVNYPKERIEYLIKDSGTKLVLTSNNQIDSVFDHVRTLFVEDLEKTTRANVVLENMNSPSDLCYVIYTSGTTGNPKGVMVEHRNVVRLFFNEQFQFDFDSNDTWTMFHSHCFDFSVWEIYGALLFGGKLIIVPKLVAMDTLEYLKILREEKVTVLNQTPSAFYNLLREEQLSHDASLNLRYVIFGGEALSPAKLEVWRNRYPSVKLINMFGITETTVHVTYKEIGVYEISNNISSVGKPIPTLSVYILDKYQKLVPKGIVGELYVGGAGVSRGYLGKKELTDARFIQNPYNFDERLYRSGDLGRVLTSGDIEYLGRIDHQVQLRGFRVELGEIENQLISHGNIKEAVVLAKEKEGDKYLTAYYVSDQEIGIVELREFLSGKLPDYMIPSYFVRLENLPLTSNGKLDRKALPDPEVKVGNDYVEPSNEIERRIVGIWSEVLKINKELISVTKSFFELGGHSLLATILVSRIHKELNIKLELKQVFEYYTIKSQTEIIKSIKYKGFLNVKSSEKKEYYNLSSAQKRMYIAIQMDKNSTFYNISGAFELEGFLQINRFENVFRKIIQRHEILRTSFETIEEKVVQRVHSNFEFYIQNYEINNQGISSVLNSFIKPFDLTRSPLLHVGVIYINRKKCIIMIDMPHIISDGLSMNIIGKEFIELLKGQELSDVKLHYKDFVDYQEEMINNGSLEKIESFWLNKFKNKLPESSLPYDFIRPEIRSIRSGDRVYVRINKDSYLLTKKMLNETGVTLYMLLLAAYNVLLHKYSRLEDIIVGTLVTGRSNIEFNETIGMFVNMLAIRNFPTKTKLFSEFLNDLKNNVLEVFENQDYQFDELIKKLNLQGSGNKNPLFDTNFQIDNLEKLDLNISGLNISSIDFERDFAKFDLHFIISEDEDGINILLRYSTELFERLTVETLLDDYLSVIDQVIKDYHIKISDIKIGHDLSEVKSNVFQEESPSFEF